MNRVKNDSVRYKLVKLSECGTKIGYYNSELNPEDSWPTKDVDKALILTENEVKGIMLIEDVTKQRFNTKHSIFKIQV